VVFDFKYDGGGFGKGGASTLSVDGKPVAQGRIDNTMPGRFSFDETFDIGEDTGTPVNEDYDVPFNFTGKIEKVVVNLGEYKLGADDQQKIHSMERKARLAVE
jgi:arylsulfatase